MIMDPAGRRITQKWTAWDWIVATFASPELIAIIMFCAIGLLVTFALILSFPRFGEIVASLQQF